MSTEDNVRGIWIRNALTSLTAAFAALVLVVAVVLLTKSESRYLVKVGVLEDRRPSPNSRVWLIKTIDKIPIEHMIVAQQCESRALTIEIDSRIRTGKTDEATSRLKATEFRLKYGADNPLYLFQLEHIVTHAKLLDDEITALKARRILAQQQFCERLGAELDAIALAKAKCSIDGTATFKDLTVPDLTAVVIPMQTDRYAVATESINAKTQTDVVLEPGRLPFD